MGDKNQIPLTNGEFSTSEREVYRIIENSTNWVIFWPAIFKKNIELFCSIEPNEFNIKSLLLRKR